MTGSRTAADRKQEVVHQRKPVQDKLDETEFVTGVKSGGQSEADRQRWAPGLRPVAVSRSERRRTPVYPAAALTETLQQLISGQLLF